MVSCSTNFLPERKRLACGDVLRSKENPVPNYEIVYLDDDGKLAFKFATKCDDEKRAKILAHAMKEREHKRLEIWNDNSLVYCRPSNPL